MTATSADRKLVSQTEVSPSLAVFSEQEILKKNPMTILDLLAEVPGLNVTQNGGAGQPASVFIRGASSDQTLVLMDGIEANDVMNPSGGFDFSALTVENVERIEVYRGPQSLRFGSGAVGGVINIITKRGRGAPSVEAQLEGGSYETLQGSAVLSGQNSKWHYSVGGSAFQTHGFSAADKAEGNSEADGAQRGNASVRVSFDISKTASVDVTARFFDAKTDLDRTGGVGGDDPNYTSHAKQLLSSAAYRDAFLDGRWLSTLGVYYSEVDRADSNSPDTESTQDSSNSYLSRRVKLAVTNSYQISKANNLGFNLEYNQNYGRGNSVFNGSFSEDPAQTIYLSAAALIYTWDIDSAFVEAGLREDQHSVAGAVTTYALTPGLRILQTGTILKTTYATGFKAPSLYQLYSAYGSKGLKDERTEAYEFSIEQNLGSSMVFSAVYFNQKFSDLIDFDMIANKYQNIEKAKSNGWEFEASWQMMASLKAQLFTTLLDAKNQSTDLPLLRRPGRTGGIEMQFDEGPWFLSFRYTAVSERDDVDPVSFARIKLPFYDVVRVAGGYQLVPGLKVTGRIENLFNRHYQQVAGYGTSGLAGYLGLAGNF